MIRLDVCYNKRNVKLIGSHAGLTVGEDGATAQCLEDFAIMRVLPNMTVVCPMDFVEAKKATRAIADYEGPVYMRLGRSPFPIITKDDDLFTLGKANVLREGKDVTLIGCGLMVYESLQAARILSKEGIEATVINMHTIKPLDHETVIKYAKQTGAIVTAEEHQAIGGLGGAVSEVLSQNYPCPQEMVAVRNSFGQSGKPGELLEKYGLKDVRDV